MRPLQVFNFAFGIVFSISQSTFAQVELGHVELGCPVGSYRHGNMCYAVSDDDEVTYEQAITRCRYSGGSLAIIKDNETHVFLHRLRMRNFLHCYWFGLHDKDGEGKWIFEDGTRPTEYTNWAVGEPNDNGGVQDCASLLMHKNLQWDDEFCYMNFLFVCELPESKCTSKLNVLGGKCYEPSHLFAAYETAKVMCQNRGGQLALIKSQEIDSFIKSIIYNDTFWLTSTEEEIKDVYAGLALKFPWIKGSWIGIQYKNGKWLHDDNSNPNFTRWTEDHSRAPFQRCATLGKKMNPYSCGINYSYGKSDYTRDDIEACYEYSESWNPAACSDTNSYICQYTADPLQYMKPNDNLDKSKGNQYIDIFETNAEENRSPTIDETKSVQIGGQNADNVKTKAALEDNGNAQDGIRLGVAPFIILIISCFFIGALLTIVSYGAYLMKRNGRITYLNSQNLIANSEFES